MRNFLNKIYNLTAFFNFYKSAIAVLFLFFIYLFNFSFPSLLIFFIFLIKFYFTFYEERKNFRFSYWLVNLLSLILLYRAEGIFVILVFLLYWILMFIEIGFFNMLFVNKKDVYYVFSLAVYLFFFNTIFLIEPSLEEGNFLRETIWISGIFFVVFFLLKEFWKNLGVGFFMQKEKLWSWLIALLAAELSFLARFLPFDFFNAAFFLSFLIFILRDIFMAYENGELNLDFVFRQLAIFILFSGILFFSVLWKLN